MDPEQHERFLDYLERFEYFGRGDAVKLGRDEFVALDTEYRRLAALARRSPSEEETLRELRTLLLRD
jgi:hypothetical protein